MILGLHHVTATVAEARPDLEFCRDLLGLRLVKRTVNFDNTGVYHFYYGDERGTPGTVWTTFPYAGKGVRIGEKGAGQITSTAFSVPAGSLDSWRARLAERGVRAADAPPRFDEEVVTFEDPSGLRFELIGAGEDPRSPWTGGGVGAEAAIRGLFGVTLTVDRADPTVRFMAELLGCRVTGEAAGRIRLGVAGAGPGRTMDVVHGTGAAPARNGLGTVHHVAFAVESGEAQLGIREELRRRGVQVTPVLDRQYFRSIYFREPGGVLFEVATIAPGFTVDEPLGSLGRDLKLPPWEEPNRSQIEAALPPVDRE